MPEDRTEPKRTACPDCGEPLRFAGGEQTVDRWVERFVCEACGRELTRGYGRGSV